MIASKQYWVFDLDGTLVDSFSFYIEIVQCIFGRLNVPVSDDELRLSLGLPAPKFFKMKLGDDLAEEALRELRSRSVGDSERIRAFPGILELLHQLKSSGKKIAIWTSRDLDSSRLVTAHAGIDPYIDFRVTGCCVKNHKPEVDGLLKIAEYFSCDLTDMVMVGDHEFDVRAARSAGAYGIRANWHQYHPPVSCSYAHTMIDNVTALQRIVETV
jgi:phosphoglycolate phosphatase